MPPKISSFQLSRLLGGGHDPCKLENPILVGLTCGAAFLLAFLLINPPDGRNLLANRWLAVFVAAYGCAMLEIFLHVAGFAALFRTLADFSEVTRFIAPPALYLSISSFVDPDRCVRRKDFLHLTPFAFFLVLMAPHMLSGQNIQIASSALANVLFGFFRMTLPVQTVVYWVLSYRKLRCHQQNIRKIVSSVDQVNLD